MQGQFLIIGSAVVIALIIVIVVVGLLMVLAKEVVWPIISDKITTGVEEIAYVEIVDEARL